MVLHANQISETLCRLIVYKTIFTVQYWFYSLKLMENQDINYINFNRLKTDYTIETYLKLLRFINIKSKLLKNTILSVFYFAK